MNRSHNKLSKDAYFADITRTREVKTIFILSLLLNTVSINYFLVEMKVVVL